MFRLLLLSILNVLLLPPGSSALLTLERPSDQKLREDEFARDAEDEDTILCARVDAVGHIDGRVAGQPNLFPFLISVTPLKIISGSPHASFEVGKKTDFRIHSPAQTFGEDEAKLQGRTFKLLLHRSEENWVLTSGSEDTACSEGSW